VLDELGQQTGMRQWRHELRRLVAYGLLEKAGESTRGGSRAYYRIPDREGVERALAKVGGDSHT
jgi:predicted transcriptional regulator